MADQFDYRLLARGVDPIKLDNPLDNALAAAKVQGAQSQNALAGAQAQQAQRTIGIQNELDNFDGSDPSKLSRPAQKQFSAEQSAQKMAALDQHMKVIEAGTQLAQGATDQASWDAFRQEMAGYDPKAAQNIPAQFDPATRDAFVVKGLSVKDSFANQMKMMEMQSKDADRQEMMNYRRDMLGIAQQNANSNATRANTGAAKGGFIVDVNGDVVRDTSAGSDVKLWATKVASGDANIKSVPSALRPQVMSASININPNWNESTFGMKQKALKDFATGTQGNLLRNIASAHDHLDMLIPLHEAMNTGDIQYINKIATSMGAATGSTPEQTYNNIKMMVSGEVAKGIKGAGVPTEYEIKSISDGLDRKSSHEQLKSTVGSMQQMMSVQHENLYNQGKTAGLTDNDFTDYSRRLHEKANNEISDAENPAATQSASKIIGLSGVKATAAKNGWTLDEAIHQAVANGYTINGQ
jgi:hypothetical protein